MRHATLDDIEAAVYQASEVARLSGWRRHDNREPSTQQAPLGSRDCWCSSPQGHDWPGKADGAPHPRGTRP